MDDFENLNGYEKGCVARMLLSRLVKQGRFLRSLETHGDIEIAIPLDQWQLRLLAKFSENSVSRASESESASGS